MRKMLATVMASAAVLAAAAPVQAGAAGEGVPQATCFWFGPMGISDPDTNLAYPDEGALYWGARFRLPAGATLQLQGEYPHARYMSLNAYGRVAGTDHAAVDALEDVRIQPDAGSINPYVVGAERYAPNRSYTVTMTDGRASDEPNVIDAPPTNEGAAQELIYRVYLPDAAADRSPQSLPRPVLTLAGGQVLRDQALCDAINDPQKYFQFQTMPGPVYTGLVNLPGADPARNPSFSPLRWEKFFNQPLALSIYRLDTPQRKLRRADLALGEVGGYYDNRNVKYAVGPINADFGKVLVLRGKLPTTPATGPKVRRMAGGQMRYWSVCQNGSPVETNAIDCLSDADLKPVLTKSRRYTIVVSRRADRPKNARTKCGVAWLDWGNKRDSLGRQTGTLLLRNLASDPGFARSLQNVGLDDVDVTRRVNVSQQKVMGPYQPRGTYTSKKAFQRRGCR
ncbi:MAG: hypothetical protein MUF33_07635 [Candidatus Nanopelagicales bacterium]|jgi:hypothetical protein|nr:hypothetical protein [Candidatus Nanopelagicales bacterium]MCU0298378.1 hypothetical protein [Candidatus Nanopelagicales bacterium]